MKLPAFPLSLAVFLAASALGSARAAPEPPRTQAPAATSSPAAPGPATPFAEPDAADGQDTGDGTSPARRSRMVDGDDNRPSFRLSAAYRVVERDPAGKDTCLKGTGSRLKRDADGHAACTIGNGRVYVPER